MSMTDSFLKEDEICCICMESKANLILSCTHNYCENCIKEWCVTNNTCPICRAISGENDGFILADKPDYYNIQDEISKSLFQITDKPNRAKGKNSALAKTSSDDDENEED